MKQYYIQNKEAGYVENLILWWSEKNNKYTTDLKEAKIFNEDETRFILSGNEKGKFVKWGKDLVDKKAVVQLKMQELEKTNIDRKMTKEKYEFIAKAAWNLLDDINTASDMFKPEKNSYYKYIMDKVKQSKKLMGSDGYTVFPLIGHEFYDWKSVENN